MVWDSGLRVRGSELKVSRLGGCGKLAGGPSEMLSRFSVFSFVLCLLLLLVLLLCYSCLRRSVFLIS